MRTALLSLCGSAALAITLGTNTAAAAPAEGLAKTMWPSLVQKADWDDRDRGWWWRHHHRDDGDGWRHSWWWWHHRQDRDDWRWRDRDDWRRHHDRDDWR